jgi:hypothetical protein
LGFIPDSFALREIIASSIAVELFLLPYLTYTMGHVAVLALFANILLLTYIPLTMLFGFLAGFLNFLNISFGQIPGFIFHILLRYELSVVSYISHFSFALVKMSVSIWLPIIFYIFSAGIFLLLQFLNSAEGGSSKQFWIRQLSNSNFQKKRQYISSFRKEGSQAYMNAPTYRDLK